MRALLILDQFNEDSELLSLSDLQRAVGLPKPTILRLTGLLELFGYVQKTELGYELGQKNFILGSLYSRSHRISEFFRPILERVRDASTETVCLATLSGRDVVHLAVIPSLHPVHYRTEVGSRAPAHTTALGKAILATLLDGQLDRVLGDPPYPCPTKKAITTRAELTRELKRTRERGFATDDEESTMGLRCVGIAAVTPLLGTVGISVSGSPAAMTDAALRQIVGSLLEARGEIEGHLASPSHRDLRVP
jgi:DNA-binding IclR family transcriptional regulator